MRKLILAALAAAATLGAVAIAPVSAEASPLAVSASTAGAPVEMQYYYHGGPRHYRPYRPYRPHYGYRPYRPPVYGALPYYGPRCFFRQRWVDTPYGPRLRNVRICR